MRTDFQFAGLEALITAFCDEFPRTLGRKRELFVFGLICYCYIGSLATTTYVCPFEGLQEEAPAMFLNILGRQLSGRIS